MKVTVIEIKQLKNILIKLDHYQNIINNFQKSDAWKI